MCSFRIAIAGQHVAILTDFLVIQLVGTVGTEAFWPATPHPAASNHAVDSELQRHVTAGRGLGGVASGPQIPQISMANHCIDLV